MKRFINVNFFIFIILSISFFLVIIQNPSDSAIEARTKVSASEQRSNPNIIFIMADDLGWNDVGYNNADVKTPNLDQLFKTGVVLDRFYVKNVCSVTRAALMTGRHPFRFGMSQSIVEAWDKTGLPLSEMTIADSLKENGYFTAMVGKWHLGAYQESFLPMNRGFDYHYGNYHGSLDYFKHTVYGGLDWHRNGEVIREKGYTTDLIGKEAVNIINNHKFDNPLFLYVSFTAPHAPLQAKQEDIDSFENIKDEGRKIYLAQLKSMDEQIGKIIKVLKDRNIYDNTILFFTSDNGAATHLARTRGDNRPLKGQKATLYEGGLRVPTAFSYPKRFKQHQVVKEPFSIVDIYPTFTNFSGIPMTNSSLDGINIFDAIEKGFKREQLLLQFKDSKTAAIILEDYKLVLNGMDNYMVPYYGTKELFNLYKDPNENFNLSESDPERVQEMESILATFSKQAHSSDILEGSGTIPKGFKFPDVWTPKRLQEINSESESILKGFSDFIFNIRRRYLVFISFLLGFLVSLIIFYLRRSLSGNL